MRAALVAGIVIAGTRIASAQIVNVQGALAKPPEDDGVSGEVSLKLNWRTGNNPIFDLGGAGSVLLKEGRWLGLAIARGGYGTSRGLMLTRKTFEHLRARVTLSPCWRWEAFGQHEYDQFRRLSLRGLLGTGPVYALVDRDTVGILVGVAYMFEYEELDSRMGATDAGEDAFAHRASAYVTGHEDLSEKVAIVQTLYVQPRLDEPSDLRILGELAVQTKLTTHIALRNSFTVAYDASPPDLVETLDTALELALIVSW
jgi:hypothetical protein